MTISFVAPAPAPRRFSLLSNQDFDEKDDDEAIAMTLPGRLCCPSLAAARLALSGGKAAVAAAAPAARSPRLLQQAQRRRMGGGG
jgi:hypothetical protein